MDTIKYGKEIGRNSASKANRKYILHACVDCGKERWVRLKVKKGEPAAIRCLSCACIKSHWKDGQYRIDGYRLIKLKPNDFFCPMVTKNGYVFEHRIVMAKSLGRCLQPWERVHHRNGIRDDNRIENLRLVVRGTHDGKIRCPFCHKEFGIR